MAADFTRLPDQFKVRIEGVLAAEFAPTASAGFSRVVAQRRIAGLGKSPERQAGRCNQLSSRYRAAVDRVQRIGVSRLVAQVRA